MPDSPKKHKHSSSSSSSDDEENRRRHQHQPPPPPPPQQQYPPAGYPPPYPPGVYQYPPNYNYNNYPPAQPPPAGYYSHTGYPNQQELTAAASFARGFLIGMMILFFLIFLSTVILWAVLRPELPEFRVESLTVGKFDAKPSSFAATWQANLTAKNPNKKVALFFSRIETFMFFERQALADSFADPFGLMKGAEGKLTTWMAANSTAAAAPEEENEAVGEMAAMYKSTGEVLFSLRMAVRTTFKSDTWWMRRSTVRVFCEELKVRFVVKTGDGSLDPDCNRDCLVFL